MKNGGLDVNPQSVVEDIRRGMTDAQLMEKHGLSSDGLSRLFERLLIKNYLTRDELEARSFLRLSEKDYEDLAEDVRDGLFYEELKEQYDLSDDELRKSFQMLVEKGLVREEETRSAVRAVNPREAVKDILGNTANESLGHKYGLSQEEVGQLFDTLLDRSFLSADELGDRHTVKRPQDETARVAADLKRGFFHQELKEKYGLSDEELKKCFREIEDKGLALHDEIHGTLTSINPSEAVQDFVSDESNESLGEKYGLSQHELFQLFHLLVERSFLSSSDLNHRYPASLSEEDLGDLAADLRNGAFFEELRKEYDLSEDELEKSFQVLVARQMASRKSIRSPVKAVNPSEVVPDVRTHMSAEDLRTKYGLSQEELVQLFESLASRSFLSPEEIGELCSVAPPAEEPPMVRVYETNNFMELGFAKAVLQDAGIHYEENSPQTRSVLHPPSGTIELLVEEPDAEEARRLLAELEDSVPLTEEDAASLHPPTEDREPPKEEPADSPPVVPPLSRDEIPPEESWEEEPQTGPPMWLQLLGLAGLVVVLCYLLGLFEL